MTAVRRIVKSVATGLCLALAAASWSVGQGAHVLGAKTRFPPADTDAVWIPPGAFTMGCAASDAECFQDEKPAHRVTISKGFWMDANLVTLGAYRKYARATGRALAPAPPFAQQDSHPVVNVSWDDASSYCAWTGGRLPSEAEWEYAARGGTDDQKFPWGQAITHDHANFEGVGGRDKWTRTSPVGQFDTNGFGLSDIVGNVWEWTADWYEAAAYTHAAPLDPARPSSGTLRVIRGGSWSHTVRSLRLSNRGKFAPPARFDFLGFRCVRDEGGGEAAASPSVPTPPPPATPSPTAAMTPARDAAPATKVPEAAATPAAIPPAPTVTPSVPALSSGQKQRFPPAGTDMAWIPPGTFEMGAVRGDGAGFADEQPRHEVTLTRGFWMDVTEVTFAQYQVFARASARSMAHTPNWADASHPVVGVTWDDAVAYCGWAGGRLPTEAEWERASRGNVAGLKYPWGPDITHDDANYDGTGGKDEWAKSSPVASFAPNAFGLFDMAGNVWEWCADWYEERYYAHSPAVDPKGPPEGKARVVRSGCWTSDPGRLRSSYRFSLDPSDSQISLGFRCVRDQ